MVLRRRLSLYIMLNAVVLFVSSVTFSLIIPLGFHHKCANFLFFIILLRFSQLAAFLSFSLVVGFFVSALFSCSVS